MWKIAIMLTLLLLLILHLAASNPTTHPHLRTKEHKVHNIMLFPEKHSWCKTTPIKQIVTHPGCHSVEMENNVCVGACFSFSVPRTIPETPGDDRLHYCDSCQPSAIAWSTVLLECPDNTEEPKISKMVEMIENCSCTTFTNSRPPVPQYSSLDPGSSGEAAAETDEEDGEQVDAEDAVADNVIPKIPDIKDLVMRHRSRLNWTVSSADDGPVFPTRVVNASLREKILSSQDHNLLLQKLQYEADTED